MRSFSALFSMLAFFTCASVTIAILQSAICRYRCRFVQYNTLWADVTILRFIKGELRAIICTLRNISSRLGLIAPIWNQSKLMVRFKPFEVRYGCKPSVCIDHTMLSSRHVHAPLNGGYQRLGIVRLFLHFHMYDEIMCAVCSHAYNKSAIDFTVRLLHQATIMVGYVDTFLLLCLCAFASAFPRALLLNPSPQFSFRHFQFVQPA